MSDTLHESGPASWRRQTIVDEAALWLAMCSDPHATEADRAAFVDWLRRSNLHVEEFLRLSAMTRRLAGSQAWPDDTIQELVARAQEAPGLRRIGRVDEDPDDEVPGVRRASRAGKTAPRAARTMRYAAAAVIAAVTFVALGVVLRSQWLERFGTTYSTALGEMRSIALADGSLVELNTSSRLRARFDERVRLVELEAGEAIFKVAKDPMRPFRVVAGETEIVAVGTQFNVYAEQARTVVTVLEGRVRVTDRATPPARTPGAAAGAEVELRSGEQAVVAPRQPIARVALADPTRVTSWTERRLIFEDTTLAGAAAQFARYSPRLIHIEDGALAARQISGVFDANDPESLVQFLDAQGGVTIERTEEGWTLRRR